MAVSIKTAAEIEKMRADIKIDQLKDGFKAFMIELLKYPPWSTEDFDRAKEKLYADFPKPVDLWRKLGASDFSIFN